MWVGLDEIDFDVFFRYVCCGQAWWIDNTEIFEIYILLLLFVWLVRTESRRPPRRFRPIDRLFQESA